MADRQKPYTPGDYVVPGNGILSMIMLPVRSVFFVGLMCTVWPLTWLGMVLMILGRRLCSGLPSKILKTGSRGGKIGGMYYPAMMAFSKPFDKEKLTATFKEMAKEAEYTEKEIRITFEEETPFPEFPKSGGLDADYYVETGKYQTWFNSHVQLHLPAGTHLTGLYRGASIWLRVFNGKPAQPSVINVGLDGARFDGSACFNFMKELLNRYCGGEKGDFYQWNKLEINPEAAKKLDDWSMCGFLKHMTYALWKNGTNTYWEVLKSACLFGGPCGCYGSIAKSILNADFADNRMALINFSKEDSARLAAGCKKLGVKPYAAMTYSAVKAYKEVLGHMPHCLTQQSSLQTRYWKKKDQGEDPLNRKYVGDWLLGPLQYPAANYTLEEAMKGYQNLLWDLDNCGPATKKAFWAKAYGFYTQGSALFQCPWFYPDDSCIANGIFFNNYGIREVHPDCGFHSYNWGAPFRLGFNTICVNGVTTITCASSYTGLPTLQAIRDNAEVSLRLIMDGVNPDERMAYKPPSKT